MAVVVSVLLLHVGFIYGLYSGLLMRGVELVVPVMMLSQLIEPPVQKPPPPPPPPARTVPTMPAVPSMPTVPRVPAPAPPVQAKPATAKAPALEAPSPLAIDDPTPKANAPTTSAVPPPAPAAISAPTSVNVAAAVTAPAAAQVATAQAAAPTVQLPSSDADYLQNPRPAYPPISRRMNEQGKTIVRVLIGADGAAQKAEISKSSGFSRLDEAAVATVMRWRFVPGKRGGVAETMWFNVPINWVLE